jgi:Fe2+ or Zn2+ uptake regulation protein
MPKQAPLPALQKVRERLRAAGLRCTAARLWVMQQLVDATRPLSHFVCVDCGEIACLPSVTVNVKHSGGKPSRIGKITEVLLKGHCGQCS